MAAFFWFSLKSHTARERKLAQSDNASQEPILRGSESTPLERIARFLKADSQLVRLGVPILALVVAFLFWIEIDPEGGITLFLLVIAAFFWFGFRQGAGDKR